MERKAYTSDVSDEKWAFVAPLWLLTLLTLLAYLPKLLGDCISDEARSQIAARFYLLPVDIG